MRKFDELLQKEMTRKEFMAHLGLALLALIGLPGVLGIFAKSAASKDHDANDGFGSGTYR